MSDIFLSTDSRESDGAFARADDDTAYRIPFAPKVALILNLNAAIWAGAVTVIISVMRPEHNIDRIVALSNLILCFLVGAAVAVLSCGCDRLARQLYRREARSERAWLGVAEICDVSAIGVVIASFGIFGWGGWTIVTLAGLSLG